VTDLVSVVIPARNASATIRRALDAVLAQTYRPLQVLVVDDASDDDTGHIVEGYGAAEIELIALTKHRGAGAARNEGIARARGEYVAFLDADDEWLPEKTARQMAVLAGSPQMSFIACAASLVSPRPGAPARVNAGRTVITGPKAWKALLAYPFIATPCVIARRSALNEAGPFDTELAVAEDQDLWIRLAIRGELGWLDEVLVRVHETPGSLTARTSPTSGEAILAMICRHLDRAGSDLSREERRRILASRYASLGREAYYRGSRSAGARMLFTAATYGHAPVDNLLYLLTAAPPVRWLKRHLRPNTGIT